MSLSVLDLYILSLIDRGLSTKYDLQRQGGVSLGSSSPALERLVSANLVHQRATGADGQRSRHDLNLTPLGRRTVRKDWQVLLTQQSVSDLDSILRTVDMAAHYGASHNQVSEYLLAIASGRNKDATRANRPRPGPAAPSVALDLQLGWDAIRVRAEARYLTRVAANLVRDGASRRLAHARTSGSDD